MAKPPIAEQVQVNFRMPVDLRDQLKLFAERNSRSMGGEIVHRLEESFKADEEKGALAMIALKSGESVLAIREMLVDLIEQIDELDGNPSDD